MALFQENKLLGFAGALEANHGEKKSMQQSAGMPIVNILSQSPFSPIFSNASNNPKKEGED
jgi:hypothetical protein